MIDLSSLVSLIPVTVTHPGHYEETPIPASVLAERAALQDEWEALTDRLMHLGYLNADDEGYYLVTDTVKRVWVRHEGPGVPIFFRPWRFREGER